MPHSDGIDVIATGPVEMIVAKSPSLTMSAMSSTLSSTPLHALIKERHFALEEWFCAFPTWLALNRSGQELGPTQPSLRSRTAIKIRFFELPSLTGSGMPNHYVGDLQLTIGISGLSRVRTELWRLAVLATLTPQPVQMHG